MKKYKVKINKELCKSCKLCTSVCPLKLLKVSKKLNKKGYHPVYCIDRDKCTGCGMCAKMCPEGAIEIIEVKDEKK